MWILEHLTSGDRNDALSGSRLGEFRSGHSSGWYWRQVLVALANSFLSAAWARRLLVVFAALWTIPARAWWSLATWSTVHTIGLIFQWPDSLFLGVGVVVFESLWAGLATYVLLCALVGRTFTFENIGRAFWIGPLVFTVLTTAIQAISHPLGIPNASRGGLKLITYFLSLVAAGWAIRSRVTLESETLSCRTH